MARSLQIRFNHKTYSFTFRIGFFLLCSFLFLITCSLGIWQLQRYHFKKTLLDTYQARLTSLPKNFLQLKDPAVNLQFQRVKVQGDYLNELTFLQQNRYYHDQMGYDVITPLRIPGQQKLLLVDRGWIPKSYNQIMTSIENVNGKQSLVGYIKLLDEYQFILGKNILDPTIKPMLVQKIDVDEISQLMHQSFYPFILRLDASQSHGFIRDWTIATVLPQRHMAYAVQWFALALVLLIAYFGFCCERLESKENGGNNV
jgi:surfeit locus 1 family protein